MAPARRTVSLREYRSGEVARETPLDLDVPYNIYLQGARSFVVERSQGKLADESCQVQIVRGKSSIRLLPVTGPCYVCAPLVADDPHDEFEQLTPGEGKELRQYDEIHFGVPEVTLKVIVGSEEVQVNSSAPPVASDQSRRRVEAVSMEHNGITAGSIERPAEIRATPVHSIIKTEKVEDTPATISRIKPVSTSSLDHEREIYSTATEAVISTADSELPTRRHKGAPRRPVRAVEETESEDNFDLDQASELDTQPPRDTEPSNTVNEESSVVIGVMQSPVKDEPEVANEIMESKPEAEAAEAGEPMEDEIMESPQAPKASADSKKRSAADPAEAVPPAKKRGRPSKSKAKSIAATAEPTPTKRSRVSSRKEDQTPTEPAEEAISPTTPLQNASQRSVRSSGTQVPTNGYSGNPPRVVYSNSTVTDRLNIKKFLSTHKVSEVTDYRKREFDILCIGRGELKKTGKLLLAIALGKQIVTDQWVLDSVKENRLLALDDYVPRDAAREKEWGFSMTGAVGTPRNKLFKGLTFCLTPALKKEYGTGYAEIEDIVKRCGAAKVFSKPARDLKDAAGNDKNICLASENADLDLTTLIENDIPCFHKDLISISILRGELALEEHKFPARPSSSGGHKGNKKGRKS